MRRLSALALPLGVALSAVLPLAACKKDAPEASVPPPAATSAPAAVVRTDATLTIRRDTATVATLTAVEIAETDSTRERGMMERPPMADTEGMLFVFPTAGPQSFWMANTPSPLDIVYIGADSAVVSIAKYAKPYDQTPLPSAGPAQYVLEVRAGWADAMGLQPGDRVRWTRVPGPMV